MKRSIPRLEFRLGFVFVPLTLTVAALAFWYFGGHGRPGRDGAPIRPKVTVGFQVSPAMALVMVAKDKGLFEGIDVELKEFTAGKFALQAFLSRSIDYAISGEVPVTLAILQGNEIRVVAQVVERTLDEVRVVARRDGELTDPARYFKARRRKIATSFGGGPEFFTYTFLKRHGIGPGEVEILSQKPEDMPAALLAGSVDAICIFDPFAYIAERKLADKAITFTDPEGYSELYVLNARPEQVEAEGPTIERLVRGLNRAVEAIEADPEGARAIVRKYTKLDAETLSGIWKSFVWGTALTPELLRVWEAEAAWAKGTGKVPPDAATPDFRRVLATGFAPKGKP
jgi:ABC-type nitrate/sulfonate/bicarbonate transport system substrate-binding protein